MDAQMISPAAAISAAEQVRMLRTMLRIRAFEYRADEYFQRGVIRGTTHLYLGEEAVATGACAAIRRDDYITSTHRGHGHCIAKGGDLRLMMAEIFGKETGYCHGKGGSMHIADLEAGNLGANGVVGGGLAIAAGAALASTMRKDGRVVLCFFGDGASNQGLFHEALNLASIWQLPVVYVCENNQYGLSMSVKRSMNIPDIAQRAASYGITGTVVDGNDVVAVYQAVLTAVQRCRAGGGPVLIECKTYRWRGHSQRDANPIYRTKEEVDAWKARCPIEHLKEQLIAEGVLTAAEYEQMAADVDQELAEAVRFADESPYPPVEALTQDVYAA